MANNEQLDKLAEAAVLAYTRTPDLVFPGLSESYKDRWREVAFAMVQALPEKVMDHDVRGPAMAWLVINPRPMTEADIAAGHRVARQLAEEKGDHGRPV